MFFDGLGLFAGGGVPEFEESGGAAGGDDVEARADVCGEDGVEFLASGEESLAGGDVEGDGDAGFSGDSAADDEVAAFWGEGEGDGVAFGEGEDADEFEGFGVVEEDLALAGDGEEWGPGGGGEGVDGGGAWGEDGWLEQHVFGHGWRAIGFGGWIGAHGGLEFGFRGFAGVGVFVFEEAAFDPFGEDGELVGVEFVAFWRHEGLGGLFDEGDEFGSWIAGFDDFSAGAAFHGAAEGGEVESALGFVRVVAVEAGLLEEREDVIIEGDLVLGQEGWGEGKDEKGGPEHGGHAKGWTRVDTWVGGVFLRKNGIWVGWREFGWWIG